MMLRINLRTLAHIHIQTAVVFIVRKLFPLVLADLMASQQKNLVI